MNFKNKTVVITGAAKGIGEATARKFIQAGAHVALLDVDEKQGKELELASDGEVKFFLCDISNQEAVEETFQKICQWKDRIDCLINNAGIQGEYFKVHETPLEEWERVMKINLTGHFLCAKQALKNMLKFKSGVIINVTSVQAFLSQERVAAYTTSKTASLGLTRSIAVDYAPYIRCNGVAPGSVDTPMFRKTINDSANPTMVLQECVDMHLLKKIANPEEVASMILFLCSEGASNITGQTFRVDGGLGVMIPGSKQEEVNENSNGI